MKKSQEVKKTPKKLSLSEEERRKIISLQNLISEHEYYKYLLNNDIVNHLKTKVYPRLGLDPAKDYPLDAEYKNVIIEEENGK